MAYKRAQWHSGLTYRQTCEQCGLEMTYMDNKLDFRPWYADGFVYCDRCRTPLRHRETYAIDAPTPAPSAAAPEAPEAPRTAPTSLTPEFVLANNPSVNPGNAPTTAGEAPRFCTQCGKKANPGDRFCSGCGTKLG